MRKIGILCSGGDGPGMNPCIRSIVRTAIRHGFEVNGYFKGYYGPLNRSFIPMTLSSVGNILQRGGTMLRTSRCPEFLDYENRKKIFENLKLDKVDALIVLGGDGSLKGAQLFQKEFNFPIIAIPSTIDNDLKGTEYSLGHDSAIRNAVWAIDKIRDTASSHDRTFIVEVMGKNSPYLALNIGICSGAENIVLDEEDLNVGELAHGILRGMRRGKHSSIIVVSEGKTPGLSYNIQKSLELDFKLKAHVCVLGHIQRGGDPSPTDRYMGTKMGFLAVKKILQNLTGVICYKKGRMSLFNWTKPIEKRKDYLKSELDLAIDLSI